MGILTGKIVVTCPRTGKEVVLHKDCVTHGKRCEHYGHWGIRGSKAFVTCDLAPRIERG